MRNPTAVYALSCDTWVDSSAAPSMRGNALRLPPVSAIAMHIGTPISVALASAAAITRWAASEVMVGTDTVSGMRFIFDHEQTAVMLCSRQRVRRRTAFARGSSAARGLG